MVAQSGGEVNRLVDRRLVECLPATDAAHSDLPRGHQGPEQHGRRFRVGQCALDLHPALELPVQAFDGVGGDEEHPAGAQQPSHGGGEALGLVARDRPDLTVAVATVEAVCEEVAAAVRNWTLPCPVVTGPTERYDAFATSRAAIAKFSTVTLELALAGVPMLVCYKVCAITGLGTQGASGARANEINLLF